jgi:hypothetical protein
MDFTDVVGLDVSQARKELDVSVRREPLITQNGHEDVSKDLLINEDSESQIGIVSKSHQVVPFNDQMDFVLEALNRTGIDYKLKESQITGNTKLYQEYILNADVDSPDGENLSPYVIFRGSYIGVPIKMLTGMYRFVCSNGVTVGNTIEEIKVSARESKDMIQSTLIEDMQEAIEEIPMVSRRYRELEDEMMNPYVYMLLADQYISKKVKEQIVIELKAVGSVELLKDKIRNNDFNDPNQLIQVVDEISAWELYNICTNIATHRCLNPATRVRTYNSISSIFEV